MNDTVIGDPLYTVPILVSDEQLQNLNVDMLSLCYEVHGESGQWFNLVTDECASVNTRYVALNERFNVMNSIGVRAVDNENQCVNIGVDVNECAATVNGVNLYSMGRYSAAGVNVRRYWNRVRISLPNCAELTLVMWVICERRNLEDPGQPEGLTGDMIKFVVMRGLNFGHRRAHGLLGNFQYFLFSHNFVSNSFYYLGKKALLLFCYSVFHHITTDHIFSFKFNRYHYDIVFIV